jgi:hypothetical protein
VAYEGQAFLKVTDAQSTEALFHLVGTIGPYSACVCMLEYEAMYLCCVLLKSVRLNIKYDCLLHTVLSLK